MSRIFPEIGQLLIYLSLLILLRRLEPQKILSWLSVDLAVELVSCALEADKNSINVKRWIRCATG